MGRSVLPAPGQTSGEGKDQASAGNFLSRGGAAVDVEEEVRGWRKSPQSQWNLRQILGIIEEPDNDRVLLGVTCCD